MEKEKLINVQIHKTHMAHITLSIPEDMYKKMKEHKEIKWSEAARKGIRLELMQLQKVTNGNELLASLPEETRKAIKEIGKLPKEDWEQWHKKMRAKDKQRATY